MHPRYGKVLLFFGRVDVTTGIILPIIAMVMLNLMLFTEIVATEYGKW